MNLHPSWDLWTSSCYMPFKRDSKDMAHDLIRQEYGEMSTTTPLAIAMSINKVFLGPNCLLSPVMYHNPSCKGMNLIYYYKSFPLWALQTFQIKWIVLSLVMVAKAPLINQILELKRWYCYDYIFPREGSPKSFLFKMSIHGLTNGVDNVRHMQPGGNLGGAWLTFDRCKCVQH
jgi:hypothetical protein